MTIFRVLDLRKDPPFEHLVLDAASPEKAAYNALGEAVMRSGVRSALIAKVYFQHPDQPVSMVRLYKTVEAREDI